MNQSSSFHQERPHNPINAKNDFFPPCNKNLEFSCSKTKNEYTLFFLTIIYDRNTVIVFVTLIFSIFPPKLMLLHSYLRIKYIISCIAETSYSSSI